MPPAFLAAREGAKRDRNHKKHKKSLILSLLCLLWFVPFLRFGSGSLQFVHEFQGFAANMVGDHGMHDALDATGSDAVLDVGFEIDEFLGGEDDFTAGHCAF